jgi:hypothetical protein
MGYPSLIALVSDFEKQSHVAHNAPTSEMLLVAFLWIVVNENLPAVKNVE